MQVLLKQGLLGSAEAVLWAVPWMLYNPTKDTRLGGLKPTESYNYELALHNVLREQHRFLSPD